MDGLLAFAALIMAQFLAVLYVHCWYAQVPPPDVDGGPLDGAPKSRVELLHARSETQPRAIA